MDKKIPAFAVLGHPNEGKSSVLSTLAEDDSVRISPLPGETRECRRFPVIIDNEEVMTFIDTPGFQNPGAILAWMRNYSGPRHELLNSFIESHREIPDFQDDCCLLEPLVQGALIIFVADGSRPIRNTDRAEMEILRLTGIPRMAVLNCKQECQHFKEEWLSEFRQHFNAIREFNAVKATYAERIALLESLKAVDQGMEPILAEVIDAFKKDWQNRIHSTADLMIQLLTDILGYKKSVALNRSNPMGSDRKSRIKKQILDEFNNYSRKREQEIHQDIKRLFKHRAFQYRLPEHGLLDQDLFSKETWRLLGLSKKQLMVSGAVGGAAVAAAADLALGGASLGFFSMLGGIAGAATAYKSAEKAPRVRIPGIQITTHEITIGPVQNPQFMYILMDRALLYFRYLINWAHGRRDYATVDLKHDTEEKTGDTSRWTIEERKICHSFFTAVTGKERMDLEETRNRMHELLTKKLTSISEER